MCRQEQVYLNKALFEAVVNTDLDETERLLNLGADPLGSTTEDDPDEHLLGELFCEMQDDEILANSLSDYLQLFYAHGMNIAARNIPTNDRNHIHPLWSLAFCPTEAGLKVLHTMLEHGLDCASAEVLVNHILLDIEMCDGCEIEDGWWMDAFSCGLKMVMLVASYPSIIEQSTHIRESIGIKRNDVRNLCRFRNWNQLDYQIDLSTGTNIPHGLLNATLRIQDKTTGENVWTLSI